MPIVCGVDFSDIGQSALLGAGALAASAHDDILYIIHVLDAQVLGLHGHRLSLLIDRLVRSSLPIRQSAESRLAHLPARAFGASRRRSRRWRSFVPWRVKYRSGRKERGERAHTIPEAARKRGVGASQGSRNGDRLPVRRCARAGARQLAAVDGAGSRCGSALATTRQDRRLSARQTRRTGRGARSRASAVR